MRITSITVRNYRLHKNVIVELHPSLTVLGGPNEAGKSTLIEAAHRALFLRARTTGEAQRGMVSRYHAGYPEVEVRFETGNRVYHLVKRFAGINGTSSLTELGGSSWHADEAEARLSELLGITPMSGGRGAAERVQQQWAHLWVTQGVAGENPIRHATDQRDSLIARLQSLGGAAAMQSELDSRVAKMIADQYEGLFTRSGAPKKGSALAKATARLEEAQRDRQQAQESYLRLEQSITDYNEASDAIQTSQDVLQGLAQELESVEAKLTQVAALKEHERDQQKAANEAKSTHEDYHARDLAIRQLRERIRVSTEATQPKEEEVRRRKEEAGRCREALRSALDALGDATRSLNSARSHKGLAENYVKLFANTRQLKSLKEERSRVRQIIRHRAALESELAKLASIDADDLKQIQGADRQCREAIVALKATAAEIAVIASDCRVLVGDKTLDVGDSEIVTDETEILVGSSVRLLVRPGGGSSLLEARRRADDAARELQELLHAYEVQSVAQAEDACARRLDLRQKIDVDNGRLEGCTVDDLEQQIAHTDAARTAAQAAIDQHDLSHIAFAIPADEKAARDLLVQSEKHLSDAVNREDRCKLERAQADGRVEEALRLGQSAEQSLRDDSDQLRTLHAELKVRLQHDGSDADRSAKLTQLLAKKTTAEKDLAATQKLLAELQPEALERDKSRLLRSIEGLTAKKTDAEEKRLIAKGALSRDGETDPQESLIYAEVALRNAQEETTRLQRAADAVALLFTLFKAEQQSLADKLSQPFAVKIEQYLRCVFDLGVNVKLQMENNSFCGLEMSRVGHGDGAFSFDTLSAGTKEQLAAAVRLAMAEILAEGYDRCLPLVFDDAFTFSDPDRIERLQRMLDLAASRGLQLIIVTCNPSDYAALGAKEVILQAERQLRVIADQGAGPLPAPS